MIIQTRIKKWGNSFGIVVPIDEIKERNLREGEEVIVKIEKKRTIKQIFGSLKNWKIDSQKLKDELREDWSK